MLVYMEVFIFLALLIMGLHCLYTFYNLSSKIKVNKSETLTGEYREHVINWINNIDKDQSFGDEMKERQRIIGEMRLTIEKEKINKELLRGKLYIVSGNNASTKKPKNKMIS